jgi:hypothetical protein
MKVLVIAQTPGELGWACKQASKTSSAAISWHILRVGDAEATPLPTTAGLSSCQFISLDDLDIDSERVWQDLQELQAELWSDLDPAPRKQLHLVSQWTIAATLVGLVYAEATIAAALEQVCPDEVRLPPRWCSFTAEHTPLTISHLQWLVWSRSTSSEVKCRRPLLVCCFDTLLPVFAALEQAARYLFVLAFDVRNILSWIAATGVRRLLQMLPTDRDGERSLDAQLADAILLTNADRDLSRQFDLKRLSPQTARRILICLLDSGRLLPLSAFQSRNESSPWPAEELKTAPFSRLRQRAVSSFVASLFPTLITPLVIGHRNVWFCSAFPARVSSRLSPRFQRLLGAAVMARERLLNWRRIVYGSREFSLACQVAQALRPTLVVVSDSIDRHRALSLAARYSGITSLSTSHGIRMCKENFVNTYSLADLHCDFGHSIGHMTGTPPQGVLNQRIVCHDLEQATKHRFGRGEKRQEAKRRRRVLILTSLYSGSPGANWSNGLFVQLTNYAASLRVLVDSLSAFDPTLRITIKPHPLVDWYELYDQIQRDLPKTVERQWREPLTDEQTVPADVTVCYNCVSTLVFSIARQNIPIVAHWGALSPLARRIFATTELSGSDEIAEVVGLVQRILDSPEGMSAQEARASTRALHNKFVEPAVGGLETAINLSLQHERELHSFLLQAEPQPSDGGTNVSND